MHIHRALDTRFSSLGPNQISVNQEGTGQDVWFPSF